MGAEALLKDAFRIDEILVGMQASSSRTVTDADVKTFAGVSGDHNPVHMDDDYAQASQFKQRIAHGMLSATFFSSLLGTKLPGKGSIYTSQTLKFLRPIYLGDTVTATVTVTSIHLERKRVLFETVCSVGGEVAITGEAEVYIP